MIFFANNIYYSNMSIGEGFNRAYVDSFVDASVDYFGRTMQKDADHYKMMTLIGDPTLKIGPS